MLFICLFWSAILAHFNASAAILTRPKGWVVYVEGYLNVPKGRLILRHAYSSIDDERWMLASLTYDIYAVFLNRNNQLRLVSISMVDRKDDPQGEWSKILVFGVRQGRQLDIGIVVYPDPMTYTLLSLYTQGGSYPRDLLRYLRGFIGHNVAKVVLDYLPRDVLYHEMFMMQAVDVKTIMDSKPRGMEKHGENCKCVIQ